MLFGHGGLMQHAHVRHGCICACFTYNVPNHLVKLIHLPWKLFDTFTIFMWHADHMLLAHVTAMCIVDIQQPCA